MNNPEYRTSFSKNKIGTFEKGETGITGTSKSQITPTCEVELVDGAYSASDCLRRNIEAMANRIPTESDILEISAVAKHAIWDRHEHDLIHHELISSLGKEEQFSLDLELQDTKSEIEADNFCRNCGKKFNTKDNFCASCGNKKFKG